MNIGRTISRLPGPLKYGLQRGKHAYHKALPGLPLPALLPYGGLMLTWDDYNGDAVFAGVNTEDAYLFVERYLKPGMTMLDVGAHHGFYTILASKKVGAAGKVIAFEPSPREQKQLRLNLQVNSCSNVVAEPYAIANYDGEGVLYAVNDYNTGCNSLKRPNLKERVVTLPAKVITLDTYLEHHKLGRIHLVKVDAEGAELDILRGAERLLSTKPRPVIVCEVEDMRTRPWGYESKHVLAFLLSKGYQWFECNKNGGTKPLTSQDNPQGTFLAVPGELLLR